MFENFYKAEYVACKICSSYHLLDCYKEAGKMETSRFYHYSYIHKDCGSRIELSYRKGYLNYKAAAENMHYSVCYH
jgi:hypothetical protein